MKKKPSIQKALLKAVSGKKPVSLERVKKNAQKAIEHEYEGKIKPEYAVNRSLKTLVDTGLVEAYQSDRSEYYRLTHSGQQKLNTIILEGEGSLVSNTWDGYWRIILLDLPEDRKNERESLRYLLKKAGFVCIKNSVWVSMYPFEHLFTNIKKDLGLTTEMMILVTDKLDKDTEHSFLEACTIKTG